MKVKIAALLVIATLCVIGCSCPHYSYLNSMSYITVDNQSSQTYIVYMRGYESQEVHTGWVINYKVFTEDFKKYPVELRSLILQDDLSKGVVIDRVRYVGCTRIRITLYDPPKFTTISQEE